MDPRDRQRVVLSASIALPEMVLERERLRPELSFLGWRERLWRKFEGVLRGTARLDERLFVHGVGRLRWPLRGRNLCRSLHYRVICDDYYVSYRMPMPLVAKKIQHDTVGAEHFDLVWSVRLYPSLFAEYRLQISPNGPYLVDESWLGTLHSEFNSRLRLVKRSIEKLLFVGRLRVGRRFSPTERVEVFAHRTKVAAGAEPFSKIEVSFPGLHTMSIVIRPHISREFERRVTDAALLAFAHRNSIPAIWNLLRTSGDSSMVKVRDLLQSLYYSLNPLKYSVRVDFYENALASSYQRHVYSEVANRLRLLERFKKLKREVRDFVQSLSVREVLVLADVAPDLRGAITSYFRQGHSDTAKLEIGGPMLTVLDYLALAFLRDDYLVEMDPQRYRIADELLGARTANQIERGASNLVASTRRRYERVRRSDLYPVPGPTLETLRNLRLILYLQSRRTSSALSFRVNTENGLIVDRLLSLRDSFLTNDILSLGA